MDTAAISYCRKIQWQYSKTYFISTQLLPREVREATYVMYAFFRIPDEIVDTENLSADEARDEIRHMRDMWRRAYVGESVDSVVLSAAAELFAAYSIPFAVSERFFDAMEMDTWKMRYETYGDLQSYMDGSASAVGEIMTYVIGYSDEAALGYARRLGDAMQLTNFLRDVASDFSDRGRVYLPQHDMRLFDVSDDDIARAVDGGGVSQGFVELMKFEIDRADELFEDAREGISMLSMESRGGVRAAAALYQGILRDIEEVDYDVFSGIGSKSVIEKGRVALGEFF